MRSVTSGRFEVELVVSTKAAPNGLWRIDIDDECGKPAAHGESRLPNVTRFGLQAAAQALLRQCRKSAYRRHRGGRWGGACGGAVYCP